jgi:hypothetical protein
MFRRTVAVDDGTGYAYIDNEGHMIFGNTNGYTYPELNTAFKQSNLEFIEFTSTSMFSALAKNNILVTIDPGLDRITPKVIDSNSQIVSATKIDEDVYCVSISGKVFVEDRRVREPNHTGLAFIEVQDRNTVPVVLALVHAGQTVDTSGLSMDGIHYSTIHTDSLLTYSRQRFYGTHDYKVSISALTVSENVDLNSQAVQFKLSVLDSRVYKYTICVLRTAIIVPAMIVFHSLLAVIFIISCIIFLIAIMGELFCVIVFAFCPQRRPEFVKYVAKGVNRIIEFLENSSNSIFACLNNVKLRDRNPAIREYMNVHVLKKQFSDYESTRVVSEAHDEKIYLTDNSSRIIVLYTEPSPNYALSYMYEHTQDIQFMVANNDVAVMVYADRSIRVNQMRNISRCCHPFEIEFTEVAFIPPEQTSPANEMTPVL